jgi:hypothetical protein
MNARIGIDFGGVIVRNLHEDTGEDTSLRSSSGSEAARDGAFDAIRQLCSACDGRVWIVSKAGPRMQERTLAWLQSVNFFSRTGLQPDHVRFCLQREDKTSICRELEISHFIDDRVHVMQILRGVVPHLCLFGEQGAERLCPPWATFATNWLEEVGWVTCSLQPKAQP